MIDITIFTPTYNRKNTISRLYKSLINQTCYNFEWLVVDDGSTDGTKGYFEDISIKEKRFSITHIEVPNGGKHRAINIGLDLAKGKYFFIVDSDDYLTEDSIELIDKWINTITDSNRKFVGISGLKGYSPNKMVGKTFKGEYLDCTDLDRARFNIYGDKSEVYKTDVLRKYKFPEIEGEKFITEAIVWNRIANDGYLIRFFNKINYICEYRDDGLTNKSDELFCSNFRGYTLYIKEILEYSTIVKTKLRAIVAYGYRGRLNKIPYNVLANNINISIALLFVLSNLGMFYKKFLKVF